MAVPVADDLPDDDDLSLERDSDLDLEDNEPSRLISFENLESLMKHIIMKFKTLELQNTEITAQVNHFKQQVEQCAGLQMLDELSSELGVKVEHLHKNLGNQKESMAHLENQLERNKVLCNAIDKKIGGNCEREGGTRQGHS